MPQLLDAAALLRYALKLVAARALSTGEVREKLRRKAEKADDIEAVIGKLREYGGLNDAGFAENYAVVRRDREGFGKARVLRDLQQRRVAPALAAKAVAQAFEDVNETEMIESFLSRKYRRVDLPSYLQEEKNLKSVYRRLRYAGFSSSGSVGVLRRYAALAEELHDEENL